MNAGGTTSAQISVTPSSRACRDSDTPAPGKPMPVARSDGNASTPSASSATFTRHPFGSGLPASCPKSRKASAVFTTLPATVSVSRFERMLVNVLVTTFSTPLMSLVIRVITSP